MGCCIRKADCVIRDRRFKLLNNIDYINYYLSEMYFYYGLNF